MKKAFFIILIGIVLTECRQEVENQNKFSNKDISKVISRMTDIMIHDVTNPPLAARFFSYACLAGYEVAVQNDSACSSMYGRLNDYPEIKKNRDLTKYCWQLSAVLAMMETAKKMQPSGLLLDKYEQEFLDSCRKHEFTEEVIESSLNYAKDVSRQMLAYAKADHYNKISNLSRYTPVDKEGSWYPTPPGFFAPVEPNFNTIRSFTLDSCTQFKPIPPVVFSKDKQSPFFQLMMQCYNKKLSDEKQQIAAFWDCNPFALETNGHMLAGRKKISPGAHWLGITGIVCEKKKVTFAESMKIHTVVSIGLMDAFICCWDEKYRSNRIRPETAIRKYIDPTWQPLLQTPPFPEYLSGHSTISSASASILTHFFGDHFQYTDTVEVKYGLPSRSFKSFQAAADEAGISRFYGGIHFMDAIENGRLQGLKVGDWVLGKVVK